MPVSYTHLDVYKRQDLRTPFAGRNFAHRGYFGKDQRPPENSLPAFAAAVQNGYGMRCV